MAPDSGLVRNRWATRIGRIEGNSRFAEIRGPPNPGGERLRTTPMHRLFSLLFSLFTRRKRTHVPPNPDSPRTRPLPTAARPARHASAARGRSVRLAVAIGAVALTAACGGSTDGPTVDTAQPPATAESTVRPEATGAPGGADGPATVRMERSRFGPRELAVGVGETVRFVNDDPFAHTVTAQPEGAIAFDSGVLDEAGEFELSFDTPGTHAYFCQIHPTMRGSIVVE